MTGPQQMPVMGSNFKGKGFKLDMNVGGIWIVVY